MPHHVARLQFVIFVVCLTAQAQDRPQQLRTAVAARTAAWLAGDTNTYQRYTAATIQVRTQAGGEQSITPAPPQRAESARFELDIRDVTVGKNTGIVRYQLTRFLSDEEGSPFEQTWRTDTFSLINGEWKLVAFDARDAAPITVWSPGSTATDRANPKCGHR